MTALTVGDIRPLLNMAGSFLNNAEPIAGQLRAAITSLNVPITTELDAALTVIEQNPILVKLGVDEFKAAVNGLDDSTLLTDVPGLGGNAGGTGGGGTGDGGVVVDDSGNKVQTFTLPHSGATINVDGDKVTVTPVDGQPQELVGLDRLKFSDGTLYLDVQDGAGAVKNAYEAVLGIDAPDGAGFEFWLDNIEKKQADLFDMTKAFVATDEFKQKYGALLNDVSALVDQFYQNVLGRAADADGKTFWSNYIEQNGADVLDETLAYMMQTEEFTNIVGSSFADGVFV